MIVFRYLAREVLLTFAAVSAVLLVIIMSGRFVKYLADAAQGLMDPGVLLMIMMYRIPGFLVLILPLGVFVGILLVYGRLYMNSELQVLTATGISQTRIFTYTLFPALLVALLTAALSLVIAPASASKAEKILQSQDSLTEFDTLQPGRFQSMKGGARVTYTESLGNERKQLQGVFITESKVLRTSKNSNNDGKITVLVAPTGHQEIAENGDRYLVLENGFRYDGKPGDADYRIVHYETYGVMLPKPSQVVGLKSRDVASIPFLLEQTHPYYITELHWRMGLPLLTVIATLIAVPLSRTSARQGRYLKLFPAIVLYMLYLGLLITLRDALEKERLPMWVGLWPVHALFFMLGLFLLYYESLMLKLRLLRQGRQYEQA